MGHISEWQSNMNYAAVHKSDCPFLLSPQTSGNVSLQDPVDYQDENNRRRTYHNWPLEFMQPSALAQAGFYFIHRTDQVKCAWCQGVIGQWEIGDIPLTEHLKFFPSCPKARSFASPASNASISSTLSSSPSNCYGTDMQPISTAVPAKLPQEMRFVTIEARISSFERWTLSDIQNPVQLAEAGFYYLNHEDEVRCFHCDGGLRSWLEDDEPWREHARWFPKCAFLLLTKGHDYVRQIQEETAGSNCSSYKSSTRTSGASVVSLDEAMNSEAVQVCLQMGLQMGRIMAVVKRRIEAHGQTYATPQSLAEAVLDDQLAADEDDDDDEEQNYERSRPMQSTVFNLLWSGIVQSASTSAVPIPGTSSVAEPPQPLVNISDDEKAENRVAIEEAIDALEVASTPPNKRLDANADPRDLQDSLQEENKRLRDARECKICMNNEIGVVFVPCGHLVTCVQCAVACVSCPICRATINGQVRTFLV